MGTRGIENNALTETKEAEEIIFTTPTLNKSHRFFTRYQEKYNENARFFGAEGFDAMNSLYSAVSVCRNSLGCIYSRYLNRLLDGALGSVRFDDTGVATYPITFKIVKDGKFETVSFNVSEQDTTPGTPQTPHHERF